MAKSLFFRHQMISFLGKHIPRSSEGKAIMTLPGEDKETQPLQPNFSLPSHAAAFWITSRTLSIACM